MMQPQDESPDGERTTAQFPLPATRSLLPELEPMHEVSFAGGVETEFSLVLDPIQSEYVEHSKLWTSKMETLPKEPDGRIKLGSMRTAPPKNTETFSQKESIPRRFNIPIPSDEAIDIVDFKPYDLPSIAPGMEEGEEEGWGGDHSTLPLVRDDPMEFQRRSEQPSGEMLPLRSDSKSLKVVTNLAQESNLVHIPRPKSVLNANSKLENVAPNLKVGELTREVHQLIASASTSKGSRKTTSAIRGSPVPIRPSIVAKNVRVEMIKSLGGLVSVPSSQTRGKKSIFN